MKIESVTNVNKKTPIEKRDPTPRTKNAIQPKLPSFKNSISSKPNKIVSKTSSVPMKMQE